MIQTLRNTYVLCTLCCLQLHHIIFSSERPERRISSRVHQSRSLRQTTLTENNTNNETVEKTIENGIKTEDDNDQDGEGEGWLQLLCNNRHSGNF